MQSVQIRMARAGLGMTQDQLAAKAGIPPGELARFEAGGDVDGEAETKLRAALQASGIELIGDDAVRLKTMQEGGETIPLENLSSSNDE